MRGIASIRSTARHLYPDWAGARTDKSLFLTNGLLFHFRDYLLDLSEQMNAFVAVALQATHDFSEIGDCAFYCAAGFRETHLFTPGSFGECSDQITAMQLPLI
jgi:hypothetical protein